jgi:hypothetical protein
VTILKTTNAEHHITIDGNMPKLELAPFIFTKSEADIESIYNKINTQTYEYSDDNALNTAIVSRMFTKFWTYQPVNQKQHRNYLFSIKDAVSIIADSSSIDRDIADIEGSLTAMFKGVNKALVFPMLLTPIRDSIEREVRDCAVDPMFATVVNKKKFVNIFDTDEVVRLSPKALIKLYKYPEADAKALFKNLCGNGIKFFIQNPNTVRDQIPAHEVTYFQGFDSKMKVCWDVPVELKSSFEFSKDEKLASLVNLLDKELPIKKLSLWKSLTREWFHNSKTSSWDDLSIDDQKRHIVNFIRHSYYGYSQAYKISDRSIAAVLHDLAHELILRRIFNTFPYLSGECKRQLNQNT